MADKNQATPANTETAPAPSDFIRDIVKADLGQSKYPQIHTRFPPEPNGYLHIGHAKSICLNFGIAREFSGVCNLRMDDTNPTKEDVEYVDSIIEDVRWLIGGWAADHLGLKPKGATPVRQETDGNADFYLAPSSSAREVEPFYASDYFEQLYEYALRLIRKGAAYVDDLSAEDTDKYRGAPDRPGKESPFRTRSTEENLDLFARMKNGEFPDGTRTLRAKIDMASPNVWMRDPVLYRIRHAEHHHTGNRWCIYPMYDFAHCLSDYIEGITHSICTLEFEVHRPLYDWILERLDLPRPLPRQYEFARLSLGSPAQRSVHGSSKKAISYQSQSPQTTKQKSRHCLRSTVAPGGVRLSFSFGGSHTLCRNNQQQTMDSIAKKTQATFRILFFVLAIISAVLWYFVPSIKTVAGWATLVFGAMLVISFMMGPGIPGLPTCAVRGRRCKISWSSVEVQTSEPKFDDQAKALLFQPGTDRGFVCKNCGALVCEPCFLQVHRKCPHCQSTEFQFAWLKQ